MPMWTARQCECSPRSFIGPLLNCYYNARTWHTTLRNIIPLPDLNAPPDSPTHLNAYQEFPPGSTVMALYPDTSCFYRAQVIASPKEVNPVGRVSFSDPCCDIDSASISLYSRALLRRSRKLEKCTSSNSKMITIKNTQSTLNGSSSTLAHDMMLSPGFP